MFISTIQFLIIYVLASMILGFLLFGISLLSSYTSSVSNINKVYTYECGFMSYSDTRHKFDIVFYLLGILFILFDLEVSFLLPWSRLGLDSPAPIFTYIYIFIFILGVGFLYEWNNEALEFKSLNY